MIVSSLVKAAPSWFVWVALALLVTASAGWGWVKGAASVQQDWNTERMTQTIAVLRIQAAQPIITENVLSEHVFRDRIIREKADSIIREVPTYVKENCDPDGLLPTGFRWVHDAGACNGRCPADASADPDGATTAEARTDPR